MKLVIAEKPSMGRTIAYALGSKNKGNGFLSGEEYIVTWCFGHLYELSELNSYFISNFQKGDKIKWSDTIQYLPYIPESFKFDEKKDCKGQIEIIASLVGSTAVDEIYHAGDADREGEVIVRLLLERVNKENKPVKRFWTSSLEAKDIRAAIKSARPDSEYNLLYKSGQARMYIDWLLGIQYTRLISVKSGGRLLRTGRCVYPIVECIVNRERAIRDFTPEKYYAVSGKSTEGIALNSSRKFDSEEEAKEYASFLRENDAVVISTEKKDVVFNPQNLFSLSSLQSYVSKKYGEISPSAVLGAAQKLYEKGLISYPRTNSNFLTSSESSMVDRVLESIGDSNLENNTKNKKVYDDSKVESHSALCPTTRIPSNLSGEEELIYDIILSRVKAVFCASKCIAARSKIVIACGDEEFKVQGDIIKQRGWMDYEESSKKDKIIPELKEGDILSVAWSAKEKQTSPPKRFNVESLNSWMLTPTKDESVNMSEYTEEDWKNILSDATICTEATRADTIDKCIKAGYISLEKGTYKAQAFGEYFVDVNKALGTDLSVKTTVDLSKKMHDVIDGKVTLEELLSETEQSMKEVFSSGKEIPSSLTFTKDIDSLCTCPKCHTGLILENSKAFSCNNRDCNFVIFKKNKYFEKIGAKITRKRVEELCTKGKVKINKLKSSRTGKEYSAWITMKPGDKWPEFGMEF